jgi:hypothetical protein
MKSVTVKDREGNKVLKVSHKGGEYFLETFTRGAQDASVLVITDKNERMTLGKAVKNASKTNKTSPTFNARQKDGR